MPSVSTKSDFFEIIITLPQGKEMYFSCPSNKRETDAIPGSGLSRARKLKK